MSCERFRSALMEVALGSPAPEALEAHLDQCARCTAALDAERRMLGRIDHEIGAALDVTPSADFLLRVRRRVEAEEARAPTPWLKIWFVPAAVVLSLIVVGGLFLSRKGVEPPALKHVAEEQPRALPTPRAESRPQESEGPRVRLKETALTRRAEPEVLVPPCEEAILMRFVEAVRRSSVDTAQLVVLEPGESKDIEVAPVEVKPLAIEPISKE